MRMPKRLPRQRRKAPSPRDLESGAQDEPTGKGTEKTRVEERQHR